MHNFWNKFLLLVFFLIFSVGALAQVDQKQVDKLRVLMYHIDKLYVDEVDNEEMIEDAIRGILEDLDPHSVYIPAKEVQEMNEPLVGNFEGVGIRFNILRDTIVVVEPIIGGPSAKLGIMAGDKIVNIEDEAVAGIGINNRGVVDRLRGKKGTKVKVDIKRKGERELLDFTITRDKIPLFSILAHYMATEDVGYIKISRFSATTMDEFHKALADLQSQGMKSLILDLQGNGGGYLRTAIELADEFLKENKLVVYTEGKSNPKDDTYSSDRGDFEKGKLVVLVDEGSASASEIVSGAIQDWDRGLILGRRTFGKGLVQRPIALPDESVVRLTTARYYTPSGRCIQKSYDEGNEAYHKERYERMVKGELMNSDSIHFPDSLKYYTDNKRLVYGGGGIMPDVFVAIDTSGYTEYYSKLRRKGVMNSFALTYVNDNREDLTRTYKDVNQFKKEFVVDNALVKKFKAYAVEEEIERNEEQYQTSKEWIEITLKGIIAQNLFDTNAFYVIFNDINKSYQRAIEAMEDNTFKKLKLDYK